MAFGLSYMPNMGNTGAGWEKLGETIGQAFQQHGEAKGMAGKYRSLIKAQMGKDEQAQQFSDDFLGSDGTYVVDPDHLGLGELQEVMDAMAARRTDDGRNMIQSVVSKVKEAQETRNLRLNQLGDPQNDPRFKLLGDEITRYRERINAPNDPNLKREAEQLRGEINSYRARSKGDQEGWQSDSLRLDIPPGTIADSNAAAQEERSFREKEMRLRDIDSALNQTPEELRRLSEELGINTVSQQEISENYRNQREALANQPLNIPEIVMSSMGDHPWASSQSVHQALGLAGLMQKQQHMERARPDSEKLLGLQVAAAESARKFNEDTAPDRAKAIKAGAGSAVQKHKDLVNQAKVDSKGLDQDLLDKILDGDFSALSGLSSSEESRYLRAAQSYTNIKNRQIQDAFLKLKQNAKPGISGTILTNSRILAENASKAMDDLRKDIRQAKAVKSSNPEMAKNLGYDIPQMEKDLKKYEKEMEKYRGILDQALSEGSGNTYDTKTKTFK